MYRFQSINNQMKSKKMSYKRYLLPVAFLAMFIAGCNKDYNYVAPQINTSAPPPVTPISFSSDIQPIFNTDCNKSGCHDGNNYDPNLTAGNSYDALFNTGDIDTTNAANSKIYIRITYPTSNSKFMPKGGSPLANSEISKILGWIQQGAKNN